MRTIPIWKTTIIVVCLFLAATSTALAAKHHWRHTDNSTSYCDHGLVSQQGYTAHKGVVAVVEGTLPLGTWIKLRKPVFGRYVWVVRDHIGWGSELDFWSSSCSASEQYGRRPADYRVIPNPKRKKHHKTH